MRAGLVAGAALIAVAGCGAPADDESSRLNPIGPTVTIPPDGTAGPALDDAAVRARLLTTADLPVGFVQAPSLEDLGLPPADATSETDKSSTDPEQCADVVAPIADQSAGSIGSAAVTFTGPNFSSIDQDVATYSDPAATQRAFAAVQETLGQCTEYRGTDVDGVEISYALGGRQQRPAGDASNAYRLVTTSEGFTLTSDLVLVAVENSVVQLVATGQTPIAPDVFAEMTDTAVRNLTEPPA
ncbi:MAG: sensor domain-containing protein [Rhodococcus sp.]|nr:sensor domain-containing protein [Rhodococcus sp. (in: high G+C Gram-positive bacteria)]